jgi:DNA-binding FadR family transcriptional regulator
MPDVDSGDWHLGPVTIEGEVAEFIRMRIRSGELRAGDRLPPQRELAAILGVARPTLRQALKTLETQGYVLTTRGATGGTSVAPLREHHWLPEGQKSVEELDSQFEFRIAIERATARLASEKRLAGHLEAMNAAIEDLLACGDNTAEIRHADARFHLTLAIATRNPRLVDSLRVIRSELFLPSDSHRSLSDVSRSAAEHRQVLEHVRNRDADAAELAIQHHIEALWRLYRTDLLDGREPG